MYSVLYTNPTLGIIFSFAVAHQSTKLVAVCFATQIPLTLSSRWWQHFSLGLFNFLLPRGREDIISIESFIMFSKTLYVEYGVGGPIKKYLHGLYAWRRRGNRPQNLMHSTCAVRRDCCSARTEAEGRAGLPSAPRPQGRSAGLSLGHRARACSAATASNVLYWGPDRQSPSGLPGWPFRGQIWQIWPFFKQLAFFSSLCLFNVWPFFQKLI